MKQFKILRTKKNLLLELIENFGGYVVGIIILASIFSLFIDFSDALLRDLDLSFF